MKIHPQFLFDESLFHHKSALRFNQSSDFLYKEIARRLVDRLVGINRQFPMACEFGYGFVFKEMAQANYSVDKKLLLLPNLKTPDIIGLGENLWQRIVGGFSFFPFGPESLHLVTSCLVMHWVNDLPGALRQIAYALKPDGLFLCAMIGGNSLKELKICLDYIDDKYYQGKANRVAPMISVKDGAHLLQRAGFSLPVGDGDSIKIYYDNVFDLFKDLNQMGQRNIMLDRQAPPLTRSILKDLNDYYQINFCDSRGKLEVSVDIVYLSGWKPSLDQQKALKRGSAEKLLIDYL